VIGAGGSARVAWASRARGVMSARTEPPASACPCCHLARLRILGAGEAPDGLATLRGWLSTSSARTMSAAVAPPRPVCSLSHSRLSRTPCTRWRFALAARWQPVTTHALRRPAKPTSRLRVRNGRRRFGDSPRSGAGCRPSSSIEVDSGRQRQGVGKEMLWRSSFKSSSSRHRAWTRSRRWQTRWRTGVKPEPSTPERHGDRRS